MVRINSNTKRTRMHKLAALAIAAGLAAGAAITPAHAAPVAGRSASHHVAIIIIGGRHGVHSGGTTTHPIADRICLWCR